jgi:hypothetical protein
MRSAAVLPHLDPGRRVRSDRMVGWSVAPPAAVERPAVSRDGLAAAGWTAASRAAAPARGAAPTAASIPGACCDPRSRPHSGGTRCPSCPRRRCWDGSSAGAQAGSRRPGSFRRSGPGSPDERRCCCSSHRRMRGDEAGEGGRRLADSHQEEAGSRPGAGDDTRIRGKGDGSPAEAGTSRPDTGAGRDGSPEGPTIRARSTGRSACPSNRRATRSRSRNRSRPRGCRTR